MPCSIAAAPSRKESVVGQLHQPVRRDDRHLGVRARHARPRDAIADRDRRDAGADRAHRAGGLETERPRQRRRVEPGPEVDVDEVDADRGDLDQRFAGARRSGVGTSSSCIASGPPVWWTRMAFIVTSVGAPMLAPSSLIR